MSTPTVVFTAPPSAIRNQLWSPQAQRLAKELGYQVRLNEQTGKLTDEAWADLFADADAIITTWGAPRLTEAVLGRNTALRIVGHAAGSVAGVISPYLFGRGVRVVSANSVMAHAVAEWSLMMTLIGRRRLLEHAQIGGNAMSWAGHEQTGGLHDATISIWGVGDITLRFLRMLASLKPSRILVHSNYLPDDQAAALGVQKVGFDELFSQGDVIHLLGALTEKNEGRVGPGQLAAIKDNAVLINAGRARLVQEEALLSELKKNRFTAILDVHYQEPLDAGSPFRGLANVIMTPHCAGFPGREMYVRCVLEEFDRLFRGLPLQHEVTADRAAGMTNDLLRK